MDFLNSFQALLNMVEIRLLPQPGHNKIKELAGQLIEFLLIKWMLKIKF